MKTLILTLLTVTLMSCITKSGMVESVTNNTYGSNGQVVSSKTITRQSAESFVPAEKYKVDEKIAEASGKCWEAQSRENNSIDLSGLTGNDLGMAIMANGMIESNKSLAAALSGNKSPCPDAGPNSNDVLIAKEEGKTKRHESNNELVGGLAKVVVGGYVGGKLIDGVTGLASLAGNTTNISDSTDVSANTTTQNAKDNSQILDSGNTDNAKGIPVNPTDVDLTAANGDEDSSTAEGCIALGGDPRPATPEEIAAGLDPDGDGQVCSDGAGGLI